MCVVPFCRNGSRKWLGHRYICGPHYRAIPKRLRLKRMALMRRLLKSGDLIKRDGAVWAATPVGQTAGDASWDLLCEAAKAAASGT